MVAGFAKTELMSGVNNNKNGWRTWKFDTKLRDEINAGTKMDLEYLPLMKGFPCLADIWLALLLLRRTV